MTINLPLPGELTSTFVVAVDRVPDDVESLAPWRVAPPYRRAAVESYGTPALAITRRRSAWQPVGLELGEDERRALRRTRQHLLVTTTAPPAALPGNVQVARATARAVAAAYSGLLIDPLTGSPVPGCDRCPGEPAELRLGDDWLGWAVQAAACWDPASCDCLCVTSRGLSRFALPEITLGGAACGHNLCAMSLLRVVASRLLADHLAFLRVSPSARVRPISEVLRIDSASFDGPPFDVHLTPCEPYDPARVRRLRVGPVAGLGQVTCLKVGPPSDFPGSTNDWLCATQSPHLTPAAA